MEPSPDSCATRPLDVWLCRVDDIDFPALGERYWKLLDDDEQVRHGRYHFQEDRRLFLASRVLVRTVLSRYVETPPRAIRFSVNAYGRPSLDSHHHPVSTIDFNLSHSGQMIALAVAAGREVGVDVECWRPPGGIPVDLAANYFAAPEVEDLARLPSDSQPQRFIEYWTLKEAYLKARGLGLSLPLDRFGFRFSGSEELQFFADPTVDDRHGRWQFFQMQLGHYVVALCVSGPCARGDVCVREAVPMVAEATVTPRMWRGTTEVR